jgi:hypothetical protein
MASRFLLMPICAALASTLVLAQTVLSAAPTPLSVRLTSDVAECPSPVQVEAALQQVLGDGQQSAHGWVLSYGRDAFVPEAERKSNVLMELIDPAGQRLAVRQIPASPSDCGAVASAMAAVVERSLRTLGWTRGEPMPESARPTNGTESAPSPVRKSLPRLVLAAGPSIGSSARAGTNLLLEARVRVAGPFYVRLGGGVLSGSDSENVGSGTARLTSRHFTAAPLATLVAGRVEFAAGPALLLAFDHGSSASLAQGGSGDREVLALGAAIGVAARLSPRWRLSLGLEGFRVALGANYVVDLAGKRTVVLTPTPWEGIASAKLEFVAWP